MATITGWVSAVVYRSNTFHILAFEIEDSNPTVGDPRTKVSMHLVGLQQARSGMTLTLVGDWGTHPKHGRQFLAYEWRPWAKNTSDIEKLLQNGVEGFADIDLVRLVVGKFGMDTFEVLTDQPSQVQALAEPGTRLYLALERALAGWKRARSSSRLSPLLQDKTLSPAVLQAVMGHFGLDAADILLGNPYRLLTVDGVTMAHADKIAFRLGFAPEDPRRVEGAVLWALRHEVLEGHLYVPLADLARVFRSITEASVLVTFGNDIDALMRQAADRLAAEKAVVLDPEGVYLPKYHQYEREAARKLVQFMSPSELEVDLDTFLLNYEKNQQIDLSDAQREAVRMLIAHRVLVLTGLPGTGKTTLVRAFVQLFRQASMSYSLMAPTGIAAKRLAALTGADAATIHRTLRCDGVSWFHNSHNKFTVDAVIVDEMSMVDQELFYRTLDALHPGTMVVLVGDDAQLPSVGPGNVLHELLSCPEIPHIRLTQIFRQEATSDIILASHKIHAGQNPIPQTVNRDLEFQFVHVEDEGQLATMIVEFAAKLKGRNDNFQVLSPKYEGLVGVNQLNDRLRERLNPSRGQPEWLAGTLSCREGDRLMVVQNNYDLNVYNGDMCKLVGIERDSLRLRVHSLRTDGIETLVHVPKSTAPDLLRLAYAITVHKSQGSEFDTILMPIVRTQGWMLQRNLLYTAITRARKRVWLLGDPQAVQRAVDNDKVIQRNSALGRAVSAEFFGAIGVSSC